MSLIIYIFSFSCNRLAHHFPIELKIRLNLEDSVAQLDVESNSETLLVLMASFGSKLTTRIRCIHLLNEFLE